MSAFAGKSAHAALAAALFAVVLAGASGAHGEEARPDAAADAGGTLRLELNRLDPAGDACRTYLLVNNVKGPALRSLKVDLFAFDTEGVAQKRLAVELGPIGEKKTVVRLFDFAGMACPKIGRILLNDVLACEGGDVTRETCLDRIETSTKTSAEFVR